MLKPLEVVDAPLVLGLEVASVGFPLGSNSLKLSRGVISGTEEVGDFICYQTTAPISPGSSGGPLFALDEAGQLRVIGSTFASSASKSAQNINFVVPAVAITQVMQKYVERKNAFLALEAGAVHQESKVANAQKVDSGISQEVIDKAKEHKQKKHGGKHRMAHYQFRIAPIDAVGIEGTKPLYDRYGCPQRIGVFLSKILDTSVFLEAT